MSEFPDPQRVIEDFQGADRLDTLALQMAALTRLNRFVPEMAGPRYNTARAINTRQPTSNACRNAIHAAATPLDAEVGALLGTGPRPPGTPRGEWYAKFEAYQYSDELYQRLMDRTSRRASAPRTPRAPARSPRHRSAAASNSSAGGALSQASRNP